MKRLCLCAVLLLPVVAAAGGPTERPAAANLYFNSPQHGALVSSPLTVRFGLHGMGVAPAGVEQPNTGHHHLLIDVETLPDLSAPLPATAHILHFGKGQTETTLTLPPGKHTLRLVLGDHLHRPHSEPLLSEPIVIYVTE